MTKSTSLANTPLSKVKNFGPVCLNEFEAMGILSLEQIQRLGFEQTCRKWVDHFPSRLNANAFVGILCALEGVVWTKATQNQRKTAHALVKKLKSELGLIKKSKSK